MRPQASLRAVMAAMFFLSFGLILFELLLTRLFAVVLFAQFAHLALALALLGISVGAIAQHLKPDLVPEEGLEKRLAWLVLLMGGLTLVAVICTVVFPVTVQFAEPPTTYQERSTVKDDLLDPVWFLLLLPVLTAPFSVAGLAFAGTFQRCREQIGSVYGADLIGGAVGAVVFIPVLNLLAGPDVVFVVLIATGLAAAWLFRTVGADGPMKLAGAVVAVSIVLGGIGLTGVEVIKVRYAAGYAEENVTYSSWTALTRLSIHEDEKRGAYMLLDNTSASEIVQTEKRRRKLATTAANRAVAFRLHEPGAHIAILAASAGPEVAVAQHWGHSNIEAVDIAGEIFDIVAEKYGDAPANPYTHGNTVRVKSDGRAAILHAKEPYDIILMVHANLWSSAGLLSNAWSPSLLETQEAFETYLEHLSDDGIISFGRGKSTDTIVRAATAALLERGATKPHQHILYVRADSTVMLVRPRPWTQAERDKAIDVFEEYKLHQIVIDPMAEKAPKAAKRIMFGGAVMTDDRPYLDKPDMIGNILSKAMSRVSGEKEGPLTTLYRSVVIQSVFVLLAGFLFIVVPFLRRGPTQLAGLNGVGGGLLYVCCLGYGYLAIETVLVHELVLFVGHPTYAITVVILAMLLFSGLGSMYTERVAPEKMLNTLRGVLAVVLVLAALQGFVFPSLLHGYALGLPLTVRLGITLVLLAPLGFVMGMPFPMAMRLLPERAGGMVPWAWALNGWMSVVASLVTVLVSRLYGYSMAFVVALAVYALALALAGLIPKIGSEGSDH